MVLESNVCTDFNIAAVTIKVMPVADAESILRSFAYIDGLPLERLLAECESRGLPVAEGASIADAAGMLKQARIWDGA
eukprot:6402590-Amphidinium_carterae.1